MPKIALLFLLSLPLFAGFFPSTVHTSIKSFEGSTIKLSSAFPMNGMSGVVVHAYENGLTAITSRIVQTSSDGSTTLVDADIIHHDELPTIKTPVTVGDKVIGGYLYNNVLLLAPDADTYARIVKSHDKKWIHPDLYALYLSVEGDGKPTRENLSHFAKKFQIGLIYIVRKDSAILLDPISGKVVAQKTMSNLPAQAQFPFYMRFGKLESGWFGSESKGNYYNVMGKF
jgi:hypothetical protein